MGLMDLLRRQDPEPAHPEETARLQALYRRYNQRIARNRWESGRAWTRYRTTKDPDDRSAARGEARALKRKRRELQRERRRLLKEMRLKGIDVRMPVAPQAEG